MSRLLLTVLFGLALLPGCSPKPAASGKPKVVATYTVLGDFVKQIAGDKVDLVVIVGPDGDPHKFDPTPQDVVHLAEAVVLFENGVGFETWLDKAYTAAGSKAKRVVTTEGMKILDSTFHKPGEAEDPDHKHDKDPHVWHSVPNGIHMAEKVLDGLCAADPANAETYRQNAKKYLAELRELDAWVLTETGKLPKEDRKLVTSHDTFGYFSDRYDFKVVGAAIPSVSTEGGGPSAKEFAALVETVKRLKVRAVFGEASSDPKLIETLAKETGAKFAPPLYTDGLGAPDSPGGTYAGMMRHNVTTIVNALKP